MATCVVPGKSLSTEIVNASVKINDVHSPERKNS